LCGGIQAAVDFFCRVVVVRRDADAAAAGGHRDAARGQRFALRFAVGGAQHEDPGAGARRRDQVEAACACAVDQVVTQQANPVVHERPADPVEEVERGIQPVDGGDVHVGVLQRGRAVEVGVAAPCRRYRGSCARRRREHADAEARQEPLEAGRGVQVDVAQVGRDGPEGLRAIDHQQGVPGAAGGRQPLQVEPRSGRPVDLGDRDQAGAAVERGEQGRLAGALVGDGNPVDAGTGSQGGRPDARHRGKLVGGKHDPVAGFPAQAVDAEVQALGGVRDERHAFRIGPEPLREPVADASRHRAPFRRCIVAALLDGFVEAAYRFPMSLPAQACGRRVEVGPGAQVGKRRSQGLQLRRGVMGGHGNWRLLETTRTTDGTGFTVLLKPSTGRLE
jgi:hypothetical protein